MFEEEIKQTNIISTNKRCIQTKLEEEIKQFHIKIDRADQLVCIKNISIFFFIFSS
jgi:hypothetical protein